MVTRSQEDFARKLRSLYSFWEAEGSGGLHSSEVLAVASGKTEQDEVTGYSRSLSLFVWLFGEEIQETVLFFRKEQLNVITNTENCTALRNLSKNLTDVPTLTFFEFSQESEIESTFQKAVETIFGGKDTKCVLGVVRKDPQKGKLCELFDKYINRGPPLETVVVNDDIATLLQVKDKEELNRMKTAATVTTTIFNKFLIPRIENILDEGKKVSHEKLSEQVEEYMFSPEKLNLKIDSNLCDACYPPIIQSGGSYDLRPSAQSDRNMLSPDCIICSIGARYGSYCSNVTRTFLVDPTNERSENYGILLNVLAKAVEYLRPGVKLRTVYEEVLNELKRQKSGLEQHLTKNIGFGTGIEFRDSSLLISPKNEREVKPNMVFNLSIGLQQLNDSIGNYALQVADTVIVVEDDLSILTDKVAKDLKEITYFLEGEEDEEADREISRQYLDDMNVAQSTSLRRRNRGAGEIEENFVEDEEKRKKHQQELAQRKLQEAQQRLSGNGSKDRDSSQPSGVKAADEYAAYKDASLLPPLRPRQIFVDMDAEALIVPINGMAVPFHVATIKNASKSDEGHFTYLRINFHVPVSIGPQNRSNNVAKVPNLEKDFIKELSFRSTSPVNLNECLRKIKELRKRFISREVAEREKESLVEQEALILDKGRVPQLVDVSIRPFAGKGKLNSGILEAHSNGFRYKAKTGFVVDILYRNIKHAFFQEAKSEIIVVLHFHLKHAIMVGGKKSQDVQFYTEVMEGAIKLSNSRRRNFDQEEVEEEQREREMRNKINRAFYRFVKEVENGNAIEFDIPYRELCFSGAPATATLTLVPTLHCIVDLIDWPPFILSLPDVEIACFERVDFSLKSFDIVFIYKNFETEPEVKKCFVRISSIPKEELKSLQSFLDEQDIKYYESRVSLNWTDVLKSIRSDLPVFYEEGGWEFLNPDSSEEGSGNEEEAASSEASYNPSDSESEDDSDEYEPDEEVDTKELEGSSGGEAELSSEEEGLDWDEMERRAAEEDKEKRRYPEDDRENSQSRKRSRR
ncbi:uncharacterized protein Gasu_47530 [Galdieria sulphuraria]|uniref:FACT complex subunit n=1 Tax=Galdieria sulphuraria TaxID=130081 RepID=M2XCT3_GALSU|nr:uncharacterized protein Gasu_47530 [Galdieria sulphuraria]EME27767.1 hypothetical protein Gasu_47530 [Galdieria sulphuraria]|eukprot:XP_005704287.1 hypothetical protein Gasu_47530 [Galdieria sulphuraria]